MTTLKEQYDDVDVLIREQGPPLAEFRPAFGNIVAWLIVYGGAVVLGVAGLIFAGVILVSHGFDLPVVGAPENQLDWSKLAILLAGSLSGLIVGGVFARLTWNDFSNRILVFADGFVNARRGRVEVFRWDDIEKVLQDAVAARHSRPDVEGPAMTKRTTFLIRFLDGRTFGFSQDVLAEHQDFAKLAHSQASQRGIPWQVHAP